MSLEQALSLDDLAEQISEVFEQRYGRRPSYIAAAPGRVNLIGEHTDYNEGFVLPMAIERYTLVAADRADHGTARIFSQTMSDNATIGLDGSLEGDQPGWAKYAAGVLSVYSERDYPAPAFDAAINTSVPIGGGLSSSASLEVALATAIEGMGDYQIDPKHKALFCQEAEHRAGVPCGIMDQFSSALCDADHLMLLDCRDHRTQMRPLDDPSVTVLINNSNVKHSLAGGEYAERRAQCELAAERLKVDSLRDANMQMLDLAKLEDILHRRARHVITEIDRTVQAAEALGVRQWEKVGQLMYESHYSLRDDYEVSCPELDALVEAGKEVGIDGGVLGTRMTGGGFGGCTVALVRTKDAEEAAARIAQLYQKETGLEATQFVTRPAAGAHLYMR